MFYCVSQYLLTENKPSFTHLVFVGRMVQSGVKRQYNLMTCKLLVGAHLILLNINLVLWTLISAYRLYLVFNSGKANLIKITCMDLDIETFNSQLDNQISNK